MTAHEPLTAAIAEAATNYVAKSKLGTRKGSIAAVARAMSEYGVKISSNQLNRKLDGEYPIDTDELSALGAVLGVDPDVIFSDAIRIMREKKAKHPTDREIEAGLSSQDRELLDRLRAEREAGEKPADPSPRARADVDDGVIRLALELRQTA